MLRRHFLATVTGAGVLLATACASAQQPQPQPSAPDQAQAGSPGPRPQPSAAPTSASVTALSIITTAASGAFAGVWTAAEAGYYRDEGFDATLSSVTDTARAIPALFNNEAQFATLDASVIISTNLSGGDLRALAAVTNRLAFSVMSQPEITRPEDLRGKNLGISGFGSATETAARLALAAWGLAPQTDVTLLAAGGVPAILAGMTAKQFDAGILSPPTNTRARQAGFHELINLATDGPEYPSVVLGAARAYIASNPAIVSGVLRAYSRGLQRFKTDQAFGKQVLGKYLQLTDDATLGDTWAQYAAVFQVPPYVTATGFSSAIDFVAQSQPAARGTPVENYLDSSFVKQLDESGFFKQLPTSTSFPLAGRA